MIFMENLLILLLASFICGYICIRLGYSDVLTTLGIPVANREDTGSGFGQDILNYFTTLFFLILISWLAVWYPAKKAATIQPAEALKTE